MLLLLKSFKGHRGRPGQRGGAAPRSGLKVDESFSLPTTAGLASAGAARRWVSDHLADRTFRFDVERPSGLHSLAVRFDARPDHAWTREARGADPVDAHDQPAVRRGARTFDIERARLMQFIPSVIAFPEDVRWSEAHGANRHGYYSRTLPNGSVYEVKLQATKEGHADFVTAYPVASAESRARRQEGAPGRRTHPVKPGRFTKAEEGGAGRPFGGPAPTVVQLAGPSGTGPSREPEARPFLGHGPRAALYMRAFGLLCKGLGPSERWITIHPNGPDSKGQPVLIQQQPDGTAKVIGGAGGSLNHLRLSGVKPHSSYKEVLGERAAQRREEKKAQKARDKKLGLQRSKAEAHERLTEQKREAGRRFVADVAEAMGWKPEDTAFDPSRHEGKTDKEVARARESHEKEMVARARSAVELNRQRILSDADARAEVDLGEVPLQTTDPDLLTVQDIDPVSTSTGLGFMPDYGKRAAAKGASTDDIRAELGKEPRPLKPKTPPTPAGIGEGKALLEEKPADAKLVPKLVETKRALELLKLDKRRRLVEAQTRDARRKVDDAAEEPKATVIDVDDAKVDRAVAAEVASDLRTVATRSFLNEAAKTGGAADLTRHISAGAYNAVNSLALAAGGAALVDRSVVDVLGIAGAAEVLARRLQSDLSSDDLTATTDAMEAYHLEHHLQGSEEALARARELQAHAAEIELGGADTGDDLATLQEANRQRGEAVAEAQRVMGTALGEFEANAALVLALKRGQSAKPFQVSLGDAQLENSIRQLRAIGLQRGDYDITKVGAQRVLTVTPDGMARLAQPVQAADLAQVRRNLDIIGGAQDEDGWVPDGVSDRPDLDGALKPGVAAQLAEPFRPEGDLDAAVRAYIGGRAADGDAPSDIVADLQSADFFGKVGSPRAGEYRAVLDRLAPLTDENGDLRPADALADSFEGMADTFVADRGLERAAIHRQDFPTDEAATDALHRAFAAEPTGPVAYKPVGELTPQDQGALRDWFASNVAKEAPEAAGQRRELGEMLASEPEKMSQDMFGDATVNPDWTAWKSGRDDLAAKVDAGSTTWPKYVVAMGSPQAAYATVQDLVRSCVSRRFADTYNRLKPDAPMKVGRSSVRGGLDHLDAVDPKARDARVAKERALVDGLRDRVAGRYAGGGVRDKLDAARAEEAGLAAAQMGFFADEPAAVERPLGADERHTLGHIAERHLAELASVVGPSFKPGQPVKLFRPTMSGGKNWARQRAIKLLAANKRVALSFGTGSGKTLIGLGAFSHLHENGKAKKGLFLVPSIAQGQFGAEAARFLQPGKFKWHAEPGGSRASRLAAYKDPDTHFAVVTHQAFRDDMIHLGAQQAGVDEAAMAERLGAMGRTERQAWMKGVMAGHGMNVDYLNVDEGHGLLNRKGKENSAMADVIDAVSDNAEFYCNATADPVKNDVSEAFSLLQKMDPARYTDQAAFMRRYGVDTPAAKDALRRELARFQYPSKIDPDVAAIRSEVKVPVTPAQTEALADLDRAFAKVRLSRMGAAGLDVEAVKAIAPEAFRGVPADRHDEIAADMAQSLGVLKATALRRVLDNHPAGGKLDAVSKVAADRKGKPGIVFAHSLDQVARIRDRLKADGHRVTTITGADSADAKMGAIQAFNPDAGDPSADLIVCSDAGATGANLQRGRWLVNADTPDTAMVHAQRNGRAFRTGAKHDVELIDLVSDHPDEARRRKRLQTKYALRDMLTSPMEGLDDSGIGWFIAQQRAARQAEGQR